MDERQPRSRRRIVLAVIAALLFLFYMGFCLLTYPVIHVYQYESSDRGMAALESPEKGRTLDQVEAEFSRYKTHTNDPDVHLCRTFTRGARWLNALEWMDLLSNRRWDIPYMEPSEQPRYGNGLKLPTLP